jgi:hypothetical protein
MPGVNPLNPPNVNEVLRRDQALRRETGYDHESWPRPKRTSRLIRKLAMLISGRRKKDG